MRKSLFECVRRDFCTVRNVVQLVYRVVKIVPRKTKIVDRLGEIVERLGKCFECRRNGIHIKILCHHQNTVADVAESDCNIFVCLCERQKIFVKLGNVRLDVSFVNKVF